HSVRQRSGRERAPIVLSTRSWEPVYGVDIAIQAFAQVRRKVPSARLVLAGDGSQSAKLKANLGRHGLTARVHLPGRISQSELSVYYQDADVYLSCSYSDGSSVSLMEALAAGLPVVATDISGQSRMDRARGKWLALPRGRRARLCPGTCSSTQPGLTSAKPDGGAQPRHCPLAGRLARTRRNASADLSHGIGHLWTAYLILKVPAGSKTATWSTTGANSPSPIAALRTFAGSSSVYWAPARRTNAALSMSAVAPGRISSISAAY